MADALARHDVLLRTAVEAHRGRVIKTTGDGIYAAFDDAAEGLNAAIAVQQSVADPAATAGMSLPVRCGLHAGPTHERDNDFFGGTINRAARIMGLAYGGQVLASQAVVGPRRGPFARGKFPSRSRRRTPQGHREQRARLPGRAPEPAPGVSGAALARGDAQQSSQASDVIHRARARNRGSRAAAGPSAIADIAWHRRPWQDPALAADRGRCPGVLSRRRVARGPGAHTRPFHRDQRGGQGPRRAARSLAGRSSKRFARI